MTELSQKALDLFEGDQDAAANWLHEPLPILGGQSPIDYAQTDEGLQETLTLITRMEHGVVS